MQCVSLVGLCFIGCVQLREISSFSHDLVILNIPSPIVISPKLSKINFPGFSFIFCIFIMEEGDIGEVSFKYSNIVSADEEWLNKHFPDVSRMTFVQR